MTPTRSHAVRPRPLRAGAAWLILFVAVALLTPTLITSAQTAFDVATLEKAALDELRATGTPGAAIAIVRGEEVIVAKGVGLADTETKVSVTPDTLFRLGSTTKMLTAAMVVGLAEEGKVQLDAPIGGVVTGLHASIARLTLHQLLSHSAGLRDEAPMFGRHDDTALGEGVRAMTDGMFFAEPGRVFSYSNPGYWVAGFVGEVAAGRPYADAMAERLFTPLGMTRSTLRPLLAMTWPLAQGHDARAGQSAFVVRPAADNAASWPAGSVFSNVNDLARWVIALLNRGRLEGKQVVPVPVIAKLTTGYVEMPSGSRYGYGLSVGTWRGMRAWEHGGSRAGYGSFIRLLPDRRVGVIVLANRSGVGLPKTSDRALEMLLALPPASPSAQSASISPAPAELRNYVGAYSQGSEPAAVVLLRGGTLGTETARGRVAARGNRARSLRGQAERWAAAAGGLRTVS